MKLKNTLIHFLGLQKLRALTAAIKLNSENKKLPLISSVNILLASLICLCPIILAASINEDPNEEIPIVTISFGICTVLAVLARRKLKLPSDKGLDFKKSLSLTHTSVALGCIPAVIAIIIFPEMLANRHEEIAVLSGKQETIEEISRWTKLTYIAGISLWVAVTEEMLFRSLFFASLRRWNLIKNSQLSDCFALIACAIVFGFAHYPSWGLTASLCLTGVGLGFTLAYLANGEKIIPLIVYHFLFDFLSLYIAF